MTQKYIFIFTFIYIHIFTFSCQFNLGLASTPATGAVPVHFTEFSPVNDTNLSPNRSQHLRLSQAGTEKEQIDVCVDQNFVQNCQRLTTADESLSFEGTCSNEDVGDKSSSPVHADPVTRMPSEIGSIEKENCNNIREIVFFIMQIINFLKRFRVLHY